MMTKVPEVAEPEGEPGRNGAPGGRRLFLRLLLLGVVMAGTLAVVYFTSVRAWLSDASRLRQAIAALGIWAYPGCMLAVAVLVACGVPRLVFCAVGGMLFGFWQGLLLVQAGSCLGYYAIFLFVRWGGRDWVLAHFPKLHKWSSFFHEQGTVGVLLMRQLPIHGTVINLCLGLSHVKHRHFLLGTALGILPEAVPFTLIGAGLVKGSMADGARYIAIAAVAFCLIWLACRSLFRAMRSSRAAAALAEGALAGEAGGQR